MQQLASAKRSKLRTETSSTTPFFPSNQISENFPVAGECITPCPLKPLARKTRERRPPAQDAMVVGRHLIESGPCALGIDCKILKYRHAIGGVDENFFDKRWLKVSLEARCFFRIVPGQKEPAPFRTKVKPVLISMTMGDVCGKSVHGSDGTSILRNGSTGRSTPASFATWADHAPAALTTVRVATCPRPVSTPLMPWPSLLIPVTSVFFHNVVPRSAAQAMKPVITL